MKNYMKLVVAMTFFVMAIAMMPNEAKAVSQPMNVRQTKGTEESITVQWDNSVDADRYYVVWSEDGQTWSEPKNNYGKLQYTATGLTPGKSYFISVCGVDTMGTTSEDDDVCSTWTSGLEVVTAPVVTSVKSIHSSATKNSVTLNWTAAQGATSYTVKYYNTPLATTTDTNYTIKDLGEGRSYAFRVYAVRTSATGFAAEGGYYDAQIATSQTVTKPGKPKKTNFGIYEYIASAGTVKFYATDPSLKAQGYEIDIRKLKGGKKVKTITSTTSVSSTYSFKKDVAYKYRLRYYTVGSNGKKIYGKYSTYRYFCMQQLSGKKVYGMRHQITRLDLKWKKVAGAQKYEIHISKQPESGYKKVKTLGKNKKKYSFYKYGKKELLKNQTYYVKVVVKLKHGKKTIKNDTQAIVRALAVN